MSEYLEIGTNKELRIVSKLDSNNEICVAWDGDWDVDWACITKQDAENLITHLQQAFNIGDKQDD